MFTNSSNEPVLQSFFFLVMKNKLELNLTFIWKLINVSKQVVWN